MGIDRYLDISRQAIDEYNAHQSAREFAELLNLLAADPPERILEIGSWTGGSLFAWRQAFPEARVVSVDLDHAKLRFSDGVHLVTGNSHDPATLERAEAACDGPVDFLFIDGEHMYEDCSQDWEMYVPLCGPGALVALHDIVWSPPNITADKLWAELKQSSRTTIEILRNVPSADDKFTDVCCGIGIVRLP